ncbi:hypothetical protein [Streptomyces sp. CoH27]|uniref:hypothetical protein n=1 Tax=Streptomyces sp. CoH27 TaxID=2875763 RepID=UPI001CD4141B|nr:hypothetical protein [Streptomyces sp. CoH27]
MSADDDPQSSATPPDSDESSSEHRQPKWAWWVVGILIPVLAIVVPVLIALRPSSSDTNAHATASPSTSESASETERNSTPPSTQAPAPSVSLSDASNSIQYNGPVRIAESGPQLDYNPPKRDNLSADVVLGLIDPPRISTKDSSAVNLAVWPGQKMPTRQACSDLISTQGVWMVEVQKGTVICLKTQAGRIAVLTITSTSDSFSTGVMAQATVWSEISD